MTDAVESQTNPGDEATTVGNYFVSNYPPFSFWSAEHVDAVHGILAGESPVELPLGLYVHIPFCRKRCDFCYFKVYTDKNSAEIRRYLDAVLSEASAYAAQPYLRGRSPSFVYFGGGTPSYLSARQLEALFGGLRERFDWSGVEEVAFECEPGTLSEVKIQALYDLGVTRLSLGVENFDPEILELNNRAHRAEEIYRTYEFARRTGFDQINIDLIAGMVGETDANWHSCVQETLKLAPESVTIYQMEVPYNTTIYSRMKDSSAEVAPVADWATKRRWVGEAFAEFRRAGYHTSSAYTVCRADSVRFLYRDALWCGADMLGLGVSSFSHLGGVHFQNEHAMEPYVAAVEGGRLPIARALPLTLEQRMIREFVLQLKLGRLERAYFRGKFGIDPAERFQEALARHEADGNLRVDGDFIVASEDGLLRIDSLLESFFLLEHRNARYA